MDSRKKILYVITKSVWGGAQKYVYDLATNLPKDRFRVAVATGGNGPLIEGLTVKQIRVIKLSGVTKNVNLWQEAKSFFSLLKIFIKERPDVIHLNSSKISGLGALASCIYKLLIFNFGPLTIFTVHGWPFNENRNFLTRSLIYFFSWLTTVFSDYTITLTHNDYKQSLAFPLIPGNKFVLIPNGIADELSFIPAAEARKFLAEKIGSNLDRSSFLIGVIAELTENKGLNYLIDAVDQIKFEVQNSKFKVIIVGDGENKNNLKTQIRSLGLEKTVFLAGFIPNAARYLQGFDCFAFPSIKEGLPYALMEATAAGLPIIASDVGGIPDLIEHGENGLLVRVKDSLEFARGLKKLMENHEVRNAFGKEAKARAGINFHFRDMLIKTLHFYE